jgi:hypothetical protein
MSADTISKSFLELLEELRTMANDPKVQQNFYAPIEGVAGNIEGDMIINQKPQTPAEAAKEIQDLLSFLQQANPTNLEAALQQAIRKDPTFKSRLRNALREAGVETVKVIFAPLGIGIEAVRGWLEAE